MSLGSAIFLSTLVVCTVLLHHWGHLRSMQSSINWRKGLKAVGIVAVASVLVTGSWLGYRYYELRPTPQSQYYDLALGMSMEEVMYVKGPPKTVYEDDADPSHKGWQLVIPVDDLSKREKKSLNDYYDWSFDYGANLHRLDVRFSPKTRRLIKISCFTNSDQHIYGTCGVLGITTGMSEDDVIRRLGKPEHEKIEGVVKTIDYPILNVTMYLTQRKVYMVIVSSSGNQ